MADTDNQSSAVGDHTGSKRGRTVTRRDALVSLSVAGLGAVAGCSGRLGGDASTDENHNLKTMRALATALYPSAIEVTDEFLRTYLYGRIVDEAAYAEEVTAAVETLDGLADERIGGAFRTLSSSEQVAVIQDSELRSEPSEPDGTDLERLNYYLVDELLFALYASPTGGELVGNTNPRGWPGGFGYVPEAPQ